MTAHFLVPGVSGGSSRPDGDAREGIASAYLKVILTDKDRSGAVIEPHDGIAILRSGPLFGAQHTSSQRPVQRAHA